MTYYELLGVKASAPADDIRRAYRRAIRRYHPDVNHAPNAAQLTALLNDAWATLGDPASRAEYDRRLSVAGRPRTAAAPRPPPYGYAAQPQWYAEPYEPYRQAVAEPGYRFALGRMAGAAVRILVLLAFVATVIHWFPLVATAFFAILFLRVFARCWR